MTYQDSHTFLRSGCRVRVQVLYSAGTPQLGDMAASGRSVTIVLDNNTYSVTVEPEVLAESTLLRAMLPENRECRLLYLPRDFHALKMRGG